MYCTLDDIKAVMPANDLVELTDDAIPPAWINQNVVDRAIADAGELIDGYLRGRYTLPLTPVPGLINTLAVDVAIYRLYSRRIKLTPPEVVSKRFELAGKLLGEIRAGKISLGSENTGGSGTPETGGPQFAAPEPTFSRDTLADYADGQCGRINRC